MHNTESFSKTKARGTHPYKAEQHKWDVHSTNEKKKNILTSAFRLN